MLDGGCIQLFFRNGRHELCITISGQELVHSLGVTQAIRAIVPGPRMQLLPACFFVWLALDELILIWFLCFLLRLAKKLYLEPMFDPILVSTDSASHFLSRFCFLYIPVLCPLHSSAVWHGKALEEGKICKHVPLLPGEHWQEPLLLCEPEQMLAVLCIITVGKKSVTIESLLRQKACATKPTKHWWRGDRMQIRI